LDYEITVWFRIIKYIDVHNEEIRVLLNEHTIPKRKETILFADGF